MVWTADGYWAKAQSYVGRAFGTGDPTEQGVWAALGLELLLRAAICQTHPALNAEPKEDNGVSLLVACGVPAGAAKTIPIKAVVARLAKIHPEQFTKRRSDFLETFTFKRNEEVHADTAAFAGYVAAQWLPEFADVVIATCEATRRPLTTLLDEARAKTLQEHAGSLHARVKGLAVQAVTAAKRRFDALDEAERERLKTDGSRRAASARDRAPAELGAKPCPACGADAVVLGRAMRVGEPRVDEADGNVVVERWLVAEELKCFACELELHGIEAVLGAGTEPHWTAKVSMTLDEFLSHEAWDGYENM